jgi:hypothetical protein
MFDLHDEINTFFREHVRLGKDRRAELATFRDNSLVRLASGLDKLEESTGIAHAHPAETRNQGGYAMHTLNQAENNDYDIDVALIFEAGEIPASAKKARERIRDAFIETGGQFKDQPTARDNAVTIWYADGQHLDFAIYRRTADISGNVLIEHSSGEEWKKRDPDAVTNWFEERVNALSPPLASHVKVEKGQFRKIVRFVKYFAKSRVNWKMPGGMIISALLAGCYQADPSRDDKALMQTLEILYARLLLNTAVVSPIDGSDLTAKDERKKEVENLRAALGDLLPKLRVINTANCESGQARNAWRQFFNHDFWNAEEKSAVASLLKAATAAPVGGFAFPAAARVPTKPQGFA